MYLLERLFEGIAPAALTVLVNVSAIAWSLPVTVTAGAVVALGEHLATLTFAILPASIASPIVNTQAIVAVVIGGILPGERHFRLRHPAAVLAVIGVTMIAI